MENRLVIGTLDSRHCSVSVQIKSHIQSLENKELQISFEKVSDFDTGLDDLSSDKLDILAIPATEALHSNGEIASKGCAIVGARTPRRPSLLLVSPNRLMYQPKSAIIVCEFELVKRQILRARSDLEVIHYEELERLAGGPKPPKDEPDRANWLGELLSEGIIDGFVTSMKEYEESEQTERRHSLLPFPKERGGPHFLPLPYSDLIAIVCRANSPIEMSKMITEPEGDTVIWVQSRIMGDLGETSQGILGIQVRHRQVGAILRQAEEERDILLEQACHDPEGEIIEEEVRVEIRIETISEDGNRTLALDRLVAKSEFQHATIALIGDWNRMVKESSRDVPKDHPTDDDAPPFLR